MNIWIVTIGNSDVQLLTEDNWLKLYDEIIDELEYLDFVPISSDNQHQESWVAPARVLGMIYQQHLDEYFEEDLYFPLLDNFSQYFQNNPKTIPDEIIYLMTDQSQVFTDYLSSNISPVWKDTCELQPIIEYYLQQKFPKAKLKPCILSPKNNQGENKQGLDNWNSTLEVVQETLSQLSYSKLTTIYVSHQAGTPAISSALQFVSLAQYGKKVRFLVSNEYELKPAEIIESSEYLRGIKIEQAKALIPTSPGAAKKIVENLDNIEPQTLDQLQNFVDFFNLKRSLEPNQKEKEFEIESATQRIVDALDLIGIFFNQENYLQGITLLSAAQETFLKVSILSKVSDFQITLSNQSFSGIQALEWNNEGLLLSSWMKQKKVLEQNSILSQLSFPLKDPIIADEKFYKTNRNNIMLQWLCQLEPRFKPWSILEWSCDYYKKREDDLRNQLVHNLRGMEKTDAIKYLLGYKPSEIQDIMKVYNEKVKDPFFAAIDLLNLPYTKEKLRKTLEKLADSLS
ncbi:MAG: hypothetical protein AAFO04_00295 [Cyanobacteria bacterium J06592_8]